MAHIPLDFPRVADKGIAVKPNSETYIKIRPEIIAAEDHIRGFALVIRTYEKVKSLCPSRFI